MRENPEMVGGNNRLVDGKTLSLGLPSPPSFTDSLPLSPSVVTVRIERDYVGHQ